MQLGLMLVLGLWLGSQNSSKVSKFKITEDILEFQNQGGGYSRIAPPPDNQQQLNHTCILTWMQHDKMGVLLSWAYYQQQQQLNYTS